MIVIDAKGKNCPIPVIMAKKEIDKGTENFVVEVDNTIAVQNLNKLANSQKYSFHSEEKGGIFNVYFSTGCAECNVTPAEAEPSARGAAKGGYAVFVGKNYLGEGDHELGANLIRMFFYTLSQSDDLPDAILFMNSGVKLPTGDEQAIEHLKILSAKGVEILVCGTCINFYGISPELPVGIISNMYEIAGKMQQAYKVITV